MDDSDLFSLLNAGGEPIVDVLLYLIPNKGTSTDNPRLGVATNILQVLKPMMWNTSRMHRP